MTDSTACSPSRRILLGDLLDFTADPGFATPQESSGVRWRPDHLVLIEAGRIAAVLGPEDTLPQGWGEVPVEARPGQLILPGFIDTHVHLSLIHI